MATRRQWEPAKVPFLLGFAGILTAAIKTWREPIGAFRARKTSSPGSDGDHSFHPVLALKDFGQMLIFSGAYATLYLVASPLAQLLVFVGSVFLVISILVVGRCPDVQEKFPLFPRWLGRPARSAVAHSAAFHLWLDGFDPPSPEVSWWKKDFDEALAKDPRQGTRGRSEAMKRSVNTDIWFDKLAFQPARSLNCVRKDHRPRTWSRFPGSYSDRGLRLRLRCYC